MNERRSSQIAWHVVLPYAVIAGSWFALSDPVFALLFNDPERLERFQAYKPWLFLAATVVLLYFLLLRQVGTREPAETALRESEDRYRDLVENSEDLIGTHDIDGRILSVNRAVARLLGVRAEHLVGQKIADFLAPEARHLFSAYLDAVVNGGRAQGFVKIKTRSGDDRILQYRNSLRDQGERQPAVRCFGQDVTEQKRLEAHLRQSQKMEALGRLVAGVAHDFTNLLTAISGYCQIALQDIATDDPLYGSIQEIRKAGERATDLTRRLLAFSRMQVLHTEVVSLNGVISNMENLIRHLIGSGVELVTALHPAAGRVKADPGQIEQVITNLVTNASDAMPAGGRLTISTSNLELDRPYTNHEEEVPSGSYVVLSVSDTGTGMSKEVRSHIFEPFFTTKEQGRGTGLGLSTVYGITKQSGGYVAVDSEAGRGTTCKIFLPRVG